MWWFGWRALPDDAPAQVLDGLRDPATVHLDARRRPYVEAASLEDALFVQGWLHARERLWQMELLRRAGGGRLAAALGAEALPSDRALWRAGVPQLARDLERNASRFLLHQVGRYVAGVNAALVQQRRLPVELLLARIEPEPWTLADVFSVAAVVAFQSAGNQDNELLRLALAQALDADRFAWLLPEGSAPVAAPQAGSVRTALAAVTARSSLDGWLVPSAALGSNGWVIGAERSASGRALFAFDSHDDLALPGLFYEVHLFFPLGRQIRGWSVPGMPGVINGYNEHLAWGFTNIGDTQDLFLETLHPQDPNRVLGVDGWYAIEEDRVALQVAGREAPELLVIRRTRNGPLVNDDPPLALRWSGHHVGAMGMDGFLLMNLATDWATFSAAADGLPVPSANITYADRFGVIAARTVGLLPRRQWGDGLMPRRGDDPEHVWDGFVPVSELPRRVDPPEGFLVAANVPLAVPGAPLVSADHAPGYRVERLTEVLSGSGAHTLDGQQRLQLDWSNVQARRLLPALLADLDRGALSPTARQALSIVARWALDPRNDPDQPGALIYEHWYAALAQTLFAGRLPGDLLTRYLANNYVLNQGLDRILQDDGDSPWWGGDRPAKLQQAFTTAVNAIAARHGDDPARWRWDAALTVRVEHELADAVPWLGRRLSRGPFAWGGGPATVGRARYRYHRPFDVRAAATVRVVAALGDPIEVRAIMPAGQSGHPLSRHYADQLPRWLAGELDHLPAGPPQSAAAIIQLRPPSAPPEP